MSDTANDPLDPADPPETVPPTEAPEESDTDSNNPPTRSADVPETQPPGR